MARMNILSRLAMREDLQDILKTMNKPVGSLHYDPWGFNKDTNQAALALFKWLYETYFRVEATGLENIPPAGRCLIIANHSGQLPIDATLLGYAMATNPNGPRAPRAMIERFLPSVPFLGNLMNQIGAVVGDPTNCRKLLENEEAILVFPEGVRGAGKPWSKRYQLQRFGNGFMHLAMEHETPIVPVGIVGCEESVPTLTHSTLLARLLGLPYFPVTLPVVLPTRVHIHVGEPLYFDSTETSEAEVTRRVEQVKSAINGLLEEGLKRREGVFR